MAARPVRAPARTVETSRRRPRLAPRSSVIHFAIVHGADGVRFATAARSQSALMQRLLDYIRPCVSDTLWPADAARFERLADEGEQRAAVELYFAAVGQRWDDERLWVGATTDADGDTPHR